jgi:diguanylate cyclase (GGDEF)-like protein
MEKKQPTSRAASPGAAEQRLARGLRIHWEAPREALDLALEVAAEARTADEPGLLGRALVLEAAVAQRRGDLERSFALLLEAEELGERVAAPDLAGELALARSRLSFLSGSFGEALSLAEQAVGLADRAGLDALRLVARRGRNLVLGSIGSPLLGDSVCELLELSIELGDRKEEAMARNDLAYDLFVRGELEAAAATVEESIGVAREVGAEGPIALAYAVGTRAEIRLHRGDASGALEDFDESLALAAAGDEPEPYLLGVTIQARAQALAALGRLDEAIAEARAGLERLGERVPYARGLLLRQLAAALRQAGRHEPAYEALEQSAELERTARLELTASQLALQRAGLEAKASRREARALAAKNRELERAHGELEQRMTELERLRDRLREQADSDWLTGLRNRRFLAREFRTLTRATDPSCPLTVAVLDLDHFKSVNDRHGHETGDRVLKAVAKHLKRSVRAGDAVVRSGGEEFLLVMPGLPAAAATARCDRLRREIESWPWETLVAGLEVTLSAGVASTEEPLDAATLLSTADARLYAAKEAGRNRVVGPEAPPSGEAVAA